MVAPAPYHDIRRGFVRIAHDAPYTSTSHSEGSRVLTCWGIVRPSHRVHPGAVRNNEAAIAGMVKCNRFLQLRHLPCLGRFKGKNRSRDIAPLALRQVYCACSIFRSACHVPTRHLSSLTQRFKDLCTPCIMKPPLEKAISSCKIPKQLLAVLCAIRCSPPISDEIGAPQL